MTTGGGWQDQVGGLVPGVKLTSSRPSRPLAVQVRPVPLLPATAAALEARLVIVDTGLQRVAKNVLERVVGRYLRRERGVLTGIARLVELAEEGAEVLARGAVDPLGAIMDEVWAIHQTLDPHCSTPAIDALFRAVEDLSLGGKLAGAGGGGFAGFLAKDGEAARRMVALLEARGCACRPWRLEAVDAAVGAGR